MSFYRLAFVRRRLKITGTYEGKIQKLRAEEKTVLPFDFLTPLLFLRQSLQITKACLEDLLPFAHQRLFPKNSFAPQPKRFLQPLAGEAVLP